MVLKPAEINNQLFETANHRMSLTFDLAQTRSCFIFALRLYICKCIFLCTILCINVAPRTSVQLKRCLYICCIFAPQSEPIFDNAIAIEVLNKRMVYNTLPSGYNGWYADIFSLLLSRIIPIRTHSRALLSENRKLGGEEGTLSNFKNVHFL